MGFLQYESDKLSKECKMRYKKDLSTISRNYFQLKSNLLGIMVKIKAVLTNGPLNAIRKYQDGRSIFPNSLAITAIVKNEAPYIREWIEYHKLIGVQKFYLFDNESTDNLQEILSPYIEAGLVELHSIKGPGRQLDAYRQGIELAKDETKWLAVIDLDEFILPIEKEKTVLQILDEQKRAALLIGWMVYGSSGYVEKQPGLVTDIYRKHATDDFIADYKSIINPRKVLKVVNPHYFIVAGKTTDETGKVIYQYPYNDMPEALPASKKKIRINHYYSKSWEEFEAKANRGYADSSDEKRTARNLATFKDHDQNQVEDHYIDKYVNQLKKIMSEQN